MKMTVNTLAVVHYAQKIRRFAMFYTHMKPTNLSKAFVHSYTPLCTLLKGGPTV